MAATRRQRIYSYIIRYMTDSRGRPPTVREIVVGCKVPQTTLYYHLRILENEGFIERTGEGVSRNIGIPDARWIPPERMRP